MSYITGRADVGRPDAETIGPFSQPWLQPVASEQTPPERSTSRGLVWGLALALTFWGLFALAIWAF